METFKIKAILAAGEKMRLLISIMADFTQLSPKYFNGTRDSTNGTLYFTKFSL